MITSYIIGILGIVFLMVIWVAVQTYWKSIFSDYVTDEDAMAERTKCGNCGCNGICRNKTDSG